MPVVAENDANLGAIAEHQHGAAEGSSDVIYVKIASGLGCRHRPRRPPAPGRDRVSPARSATSRCVRTGRCADAAAAAVWRARCRLSRLLSLLRPAYDADIDVERMLALDRDGDTGVRRVLSDAGRTIGRALADLCTSLNPAVIVVGGSLGSSEALVDGVRASVDRYAQPDTAAAVRVASGRLGDRAELMGAVSLAIARVATQD